MSPISGADFTGAARLNYLHSLLHSKPGLTQMEAAERCGCSVRQVRRLIETLRAMGVSISYDHNNGYRVSDDETLPPIELTSQESIGLALAHRLIVGNTNLPFAEAAARAFAKIDERLSPGARAFISTVPITGIFNARRDYSSAPLGAITRALYERKTVRMTYYTASRRTTTERKVDPYLIVSPNGYWQLIGWCHVRKDIRCFALDGITKVEQTQDAFETTPGFDPEQYMHNAAGPHLSGKQIQIKVRFDSRAADYARRSIWRFEHSFTEETDGCVLLSGTVNGIEDIKQELLRWGAMAQALEPKELRDQIADEARAMVKNYGG